MAYKNYAQVKAVQNRYREEILKACPTMDEGSGIYFLTRVDENGINYFYIGQAVKVLSRMLSHMTGWQHIDISLRKRKWYSEDNPYGWKLNFMHYPKDELDKWEQYWILEYTKKGYQARYNKVAGGQIDKGEKINEYRPAKGYRDGIKQGYKNASRDIAHLFDLHLDYKPKSDKPNKNQEKAMEKFKAFLNYHKEEDNGEV